MDNSDLLNYEMETGTLFKMAGVYGFAAAGVCAVIAQRTESESIVIADKDTAVNKAIEVAVQSISGD